MTRLFDFVNAMAVEQVYLQKLLQMLESALMDGGRTTESDMVGAVAWRIGCASDLARELEKLYSAGGWDRFALKLMWYAEEMARSAIGTTANDDLTVFRMAEMQALLPRPVEEKGGNGSDANVPAGRDLHEALFRFGQALEELRRTSYEEEQFTGMQTAALGRVLHEAGALRHVAVAWNNRDVARFAVAFSHFVAFVLNNAFTQDHRVLHIIANANLTLQTVLETVGAEDFDSLHQTIELLENPRSLLQ